MALFLTSRDESFCGTLSKHLKNLDCGSSSSSLGLGSGMTPGYHEK